MPLDICTTSEALALKCANWRQAGLKIGLVPTMGALHAGHLSLVETMAAHADKIIVSLFVNPTQFAEGEDFDAYPRTTEDDLQKLNSTKADLVFMPTSAEIYGDKVTADLQAGSLAEGLESLSRPHFFGGVVTVVNKLFELCKPDIAIFGEKDYQQLRVIEQMVANSAMEIEIIHGATMREADGLAMSSRNAYLDDRQRKIAASLNKIMQALCADYLKTQDLNHLPKLEAAAIQHLKEAGFTEIEYVTIRDAKTLKRPDAQTKSLRLLTAVRLGDIRLIDNCPVR